MNLRIHTLRVFTPVSNMLKKISTDSFCGFLPHGTNQVFYKRDFHRATSVLSYHEETSSKKRMGTNGRLIHWLEMWDLF